MIYPNNIKELYSTLQEIDFSTEKPIKYHSCIIQHTKGKDFLIKVCGKSIRYTIQNEDEYRVLKYIYSDLEILLFNIKEI